MRTLAIAAIQTAPAFFDSEATWHRFADRVRAVCSLFPHVQMVVVPELLLAAEAPLEARADWMQEAAVPIPGPLTDRICDLAWETGLWLIPGSVYELADDDKIYNTALAVSPQGEIAARYRKVFLRQPYEQTAPGSDFVVFDVPEAGRIGLAICCDGSFPETARQLAWLGAEVIVQPSLTARDRDMELICARANAWTNQLYIVNLNAASPAGRGASAIVDPEGVIRQQSGAGEEILVDILDLDAVTRARSHGAAGLNRPWAQLARHGSQVNLPMYAAGITPAPWQQDLPAAH
ncbi:carbon-nitrogen hydrolase family protein [Streptomyces sp. NBC_01210]|uniref:carbon-nitrogen hydrolase family protein n=1 Tax=Streptomyces sp. NBC_01210 TaxID=2903774 RepID=UPI002E14A9CD|nr:carbon-nitrogen hydrolase family protein [Streptomyces sp. NBC_01210]